MTKTSVRSNTGRALGISFPKNAASWATSFFNGNFPPATKPAENAVEQLYDGATRAEALRAVTRARFVFAAVTDVIGRDVTLEVDRERSEVRNAQWAKTLRRGGSVTAHLVPTRFGHWLLGPGWVNLPFELGPGIRANLAAMQMTPINAERMLQGRRSSRDDDDRPERPLDDSLESAVGRMTQWAKEHGHVALAMTTAEWEATVHEYIGTRKITAFIENVASLAEEISGEQELQELADLASNIWNNTPQPDRGGLTAHQMVALYNDSQRGQD